MIADKRHDRLLREIRLHGAVTVTEFAARAGVAPMTVRRDLAALEAAGLLKRTHGGAIALVSDAEPDLRGARPGAGLAGAGQAQRPRGALLTIGMVAPSASYYFPEIIRGAQDAARRFDARLVLGISNYSGVEEGRQIQRLIASGVDGLLVTPSEAQLEGTPTLDLLAEARIPVVVVERSLREVAPSLPLDEVRSDHVAGTEMAIEHLAALGHRRVGLAARVGSPTTPWLQQAFERAAARTQLDPGFLHAQLPRPTAGEGMDTTHYERLLDECVATGTTALVVHTDEDATALAALAAERGIAAPGGLSIVAYDDEVAALAAVPLTAVSPPKYEVGYTAMGQCCERILDEAKGHVRALRRVRLLPTLRIRESTGRLAEDAIA
ncbi:substrate-binding domain-containing protein [Arthrobacter sp. 35W]|uniref:substrate-binding domain-containing protein n=1 Tax=Arthrobacter sp. 35W TaxID=1132441 RepID=UPI0003F931E2|nr:substrate-binding domain-containing protein [Arthrobacter sp. 35W]